MNTQIATRQAKREDVPQMLQVYNDFAKHYVGPASRTAKRFKRMLLKKDNINWVALNNQHKIIGYVHARIEKRLNRGEFREIIIDANYSFQQVAKLLVEDVHAIFMKKKVSSIVASSMRNPMYKKVFPALGFFESESTDVFMYSILKVEKFLNELSPVLANRLKCLKNWKGLTQLECEGYSLFLKKTDDRAQSIVWTNQQADVKISVSRELLTKLIFGTADPTESHKTGELKVESTASPKESERLLKAIFPQTQFLIMDFW